jgi:hypothetical protein
MPISPELWPPIAAALVLAIACAFPLVGAF